MSGWLVWASLGLYPEIPAVPGFTVTSPVFTHAAIRLGNGATLTIDADGPQNTYIQSVSVNGSSYNSTWLPLNAIKNGGSVKFALVNAATGWGGQVSGPNAAPSFAAP